MESVLSVTSLGVTCSCITSRLGEDGDDVVDETDWLAVGDRSGSRGVRWLFGSEAKRDPTCADTHSQKGRHMMTDRPRFGLYIHRENQGGIEVGLGDGWERHQPLL